MITATLTYILATLTATEIAIVLAPICFIVLLCLGTAVLAR